MDVTVHAPLENVEYAISFSFNTDSTEIWLLYAANAEKCLRKSWTLWFTISGILISHGVRGKFVLERTNGRQRFKLNGKTGLLKKRFTVEDNNLSMPLYKNNDGRWEIQINCWRNDLIKDCYYELKREEVNDNGSIQ